MQLTVKSRKAMEWNGNKTAKKYTMEIVGKYYQEFKKK